MRKLYLINRLVAWVGMPLMVFHGAFAFAKDAASPGTQTPTPEVSQQTEASKSAAPKPNATRFPPLVDDMRELIQFAVQSGKIDDLSLALDASIHPTRLLSSDATGKPADLDTADFVARLKALSHDGTGRDVLARIGALLAMPAAKLPLGADFENQDVYVWPYLADKDLTRLKPGEIVDLYRLAPPPEADRWRRAPDWGGDRLLIGADGGWLALGLRTQPDPTLTAE